MKSMIAATLAALVLLAGGPETDAADAFSSMERAKRHAIERDRPATDFFEGALLGNGGMGVVVTTRPDAVVLYFGHNKVWDIRLAEDHREEIGTFDEVFAKVRAIPADLENLKDDPWFRHYAGLCRANYAKPYPRPFPCGSVVFGFDRRDAELIGHKLDISNGLCEVTLLANAGRELCLQLFTDQQSDRLWMRLVDRDGRPARNIFNRIRILPDPSTPKEFPKGEIREDLPAGVISFRQVLPSGEPGRNDPATGHPKDRAFRLTAQVAGALGKTTRIDWNGNETEMDAMEAAFIGGKPFTACISLEEGLATELGKNAPAPPTDEAFREALADSTASWRTYWDKSGLALADTFLEQIWYRNLYFLNCAARDGVTCPGLFANWSHDKIGTAWHGDYHMNYNTQQPFWCTYSSNHLEQNLPYVSLIEFLMPVSRAWARDYYGLPGAYFPHSAYPVEMTMNPYPVPSWGWEVCETPWAVQGLWFHYLYSQDREFLQERAYVPIREAVAFLVAYMKRPEARGPQWGDDKFHIFPTIPPELYSLRPGFRFNHDCTVDLTLTKFIFKAFQEAARVLDREEQDKELLDGVREILTHFPNYPTTRSKENGEIFVSVPGEHDAVVYNVPNALITVFPGEDHGLHSDPATTEILHNTFRNRRNEGGNDLVISNLQAARIGMLDLGKFKRQVSYCLLPNGTAADMVLQVHGRYTDRTNYGFMKHMGIWFENFGLPVVINECLMQSYTGTIHLFPNWPAGEDAAFHTLRAVGAFLVSAERKNGLVTKVEILSEAGSQLRILPPWSEGATVTNRQGSTVIRDHLITLDTGVGERITLRPPPAEATRPKE